MLFFSMQIYTTFYRHIIVGICFCGNRIWSNIYRFPGLDRWQLYAQLVD